MVFSLGEGQVSWKVVDQGVASAQLTTAFTRALIAAVFNPTGEQLVQPTACCCEVIRVHTRWSGHVACLALCGELLQRCLGLGCCERPGARERVTESGLHMEPTGQIPGGAVKRLLLCSCFAVEESAL